MSDLWLGVLIGAAFSIPIGLAVNVLSPYINRGIDKRSEAAAHERAAADAAFRAEAARLAADRPALYVVLLESLLRIAYIGAIFGILSGIFFFTGQLADLGIVTSWIFAFGQLIALIGTIIVLNIARSAVVLLREVKSVRDGV